MSGIPILTTQEKLDKKWILPLSFVSAGQSLPGTATFGMNHANEILQNVYEKEGFFTIDLDSNIAILPYDDYAPVFTANYYLNMFIFSKYCIFEGVEYSDEYNKIMLPYKYEFRYDHLARSKNPTAHVRLVDHNGKEIPKQYYKILIYPSNHISSVDPLNAEDATAFGPFIISKSQVDCRKARSCQGKNIWGENWGSSQYRERRIWEKDHPEMQRPPYDHLYVANETNGYWNRSDDGRYSEEEFLNMYVSEDGHWGQNLSVGDVIYTKIAGGDINRGASIGQIKDLVSEKFLSGDDYYGDSVPYRIYLLLPEFLCFQIGLTVWVEYNKFVKYIENGKNVEFFHPSYREIVNPEYLTKDKINYNLTNNDGKIQFEWDDTPSPDLDPDGEIPTQLYVKIPRTNIVKFIMPNDQNK